MFNNCYERSGYEEYIMMTTTLMTVIARTKLMRITSVITTIAITKKTGWS